MSAGDDDRRAGVGGDLLRHAALEHPADRTKAASANDDRVVAAVLGDLLDHHRRIADGLEQLGLETVRPEQVTRLDELVRVDLAIVPGIDRKATGSARDDADVAKPSAKGLAQRGGRRSARFDGSVPS